MAIFKDFLGDFISGDDMYIDGLEFLWLATTTTNHAVHCLRPTLHVAFTCLLSSSLEKQTVILIALLMSSISCTTYTTR